MQTTEPCKYPTPFCYLYQSLNISLCNTSFFSSKSTRGIILTTESLYNRVDGGPWWELQRAVSAFMKGTGPARFSLAWPGLQRHRLFDLALSPEPGTGLQLSVAINCRAAGIS
ncbi:hypothetical protein ILYODFUR_007168 [Ilyodon furcidens]|uniref:Uncharacterized protein n=1 Tax=Ilyodon furcidens TaxID=33524 RepID=A0ABV0TVK6_9TELE